MTLQGTLRAIVVAIALSCNAVAPDLAAAAGGDTLKTDIDAFFHRMQLAASDRLHWDGADRIDVSDKGAEAVATVVNARFSLRKDPADPLPVATLTLDRIDVRRRPASAGGNMVELAISLPSTIAIATVGAGEIDLTLQDAKANVVLEEPAERERELTLDIAGARLEEKSHGASAAFGPVTGSWKTVRNDDGSWHGPIEFELKKFEFLIPEAQLAGGVARIAYTGDAAGPSLADIDAFRDRLSELRENFQDDADKRSQEMLALLPKAFTVFSYSKGDATFERVTAKRPDGETLVSLAKAWLGGSFTGLDGEKAAIRMTMGHDGLMLAPSLLPENQVPRSADVDLGIEDIAVSALRSIAEAAAQGRPDATPEDQQKAKQQILVSVMALQPVIRVYDAMVNFPKASIDASGEAKRAPPAPIGFAASGDVTVRGFDALADMVTSAFARAYLPLIEFLGTAESAGDGGSVLAYHLTSGLGQPLKLNGSDINAWFSRAANPPGQPRVLRLEEPPMSGDDVSAAQKAVGPHNGEPLADGVYDSATALAVARYQKREGLNVNGVVDAATREKLGFNPPPAPAKN
jgi:peptidoglycan hydrolase-like protein with peptidoglycan-binding domain